MQEEAMMCGRASFKDVDKDALGGGDKTPAKEKKAPAAAVAKTKKKSGKKENPYSSRGLDKFSTVLTELESRREKVLRRVAPLDGDQVMVRFVQSQSKGWVPIVVKLPPPPPEEPPADAKKKRCKSPPQPSTPPTEPASPKEDVRHAAPATTTVAHAAVARKKAVGNRRPWGKNVRPSHYWPFVAVLLLVSLVVFGRLFAICCTSIWWYLVPVLSGEQGQSVRRSMGKIGKDLGKKASDKKIGEKLIVGTPLLPSHGKKSSSGAHEVISPRNHAEKKKG